MAKRDIVRLECDYCGNHDTIDVRETPDKVLPVIAKWRGVLDGDSAPGQGADGHRWYDTLECMQAGEAKYDSSKAAAQKEATERDAALERASQALRKGMAEKPTLVHRA